MLLLGSCDMATTVRHCTSLALVRSGEKSREKTLLLWPLRLMPSLTPVNPPVRSN